MTESTVWRVMHPDGSRTVVGHYPLALAEDGLPFRRYGRIAPDIGIRAGYYPIRWLGLELDGNVLPSEVDGGGASALVYGARFQPVLQLPMWRIVPFVTVGAGVLGVSSDAAAFGKDADFVLSYGGGVKLHLTRNVGLRFDFRSNLSEKARGDDLADTGEYLLGLFVRLGPRPKPAPAPADRDGDGFVDAEDACVDEAGVAPDGCPIRDADGDGFLDSEDACVDEAGVAPDGCPIRDTDGDGFMDPEDACVDEAGVEPDGCPIRDTDGDGILDDVDACKDEPETNNGFEDGDGCPDEVPEAVKAFTGAIEGIYFETAKAIIRPRSQSTLERAAKVLADYPDVRVEISGHTDDRGNPKARSQARADAVKSYLVSKGVSPTRIEAKGWGVDRQQGPPTIHMTVNTTNGPIVPDYLADLRAAVDTVRANPELGKQGGAAIYGLMSKVPVKGLVKQSVVKVMEQMYAPGAEDVDLEEAAEDDSLMGRFIARYGDQVLDVVDRVRRRLPGRRGR